MNLTISTDVGIHSYVACLGLVNLIELIHWLNNAFLKARFDHGHIAVDSLELIFRGLPCFCTEVNEAMFI